jgi:hypothetical protein
MRNRLNDATPADWDRVRKMKKEGYKEQNRVEGGYWSKPTPSADMFKDDKNGNKVYQPTTTEPVDAVNSPKHYNSGGMECIDYIRQQLTPEQYRGYLTGNSIKYLHRYQYKGGREDLQKQVWYTQRLIREL